jgi:hypothetical protein
MPARRSWRAAAGRFYRSSLQERSAMATRPRFFRKLPQPIAEPDDLEWAAWRDEQGVELAPKANQGDIAAAQELLGHASDALGDVILQTYFHRNSRAWREHPKATRLQRRLDVIAAGLPYLELITDMLKAIADEPLLVKAVWRDAEHWRARRRRAHDTGKLGATKRTQDGEARADAIHKTANDIRRRRAAAGEPNLSDRALARTIADWLGYSEHAVRAVLVKTKKVDRKPR